MPRGLLHRHWVLITVLCCFAATRVDAADPPARKKIVLIAGTKSHGPEGNRIHDYPWSVRLLKVMLDNSNIADRVAVEFHLDGWPADPATLDDADAIMVISDGRDGDQYEEAPHLRSAERIAAIQKQIDRGCGFLTFHFSTFAPDQYARQILDWSGGYFDWETDGRRNWYSAIKTLESALRPLAADHPVLRGVEPFTMHEEFYYNIRFDPADASLVPLLEAPAVAGRPERGNVVAWAKQRPDGGRGFATTCGHFYNNWRSPPFRKLILNALAWCAKIDPPPGGVEAAYYEHEYITAALKGVTGTQQAVVTARGQSLFDRDNLVAWCIVPFDGRKRGPRERAEMLRSLGLKHFAYDWRTEHLPAFDQEIDELTQRGIALDAVWFPAALNDEAKAILAVLEKHRIHTQLWVMLTDPLPGSADQAPKVRAAAEHLRPVAEAAARIGCSVGLYNHGDWFGEPQNQIDIIHHLALPNIGIVYNLHHGHDHVDRLPQLLQLMLPHLMAVNLNGMTPRGDRIGKKILPLAQGELDLLLLTIIRDSGYTGPIGILGHTDDDVELRLRDNLDGLAWLHAKMTGMTPGPKPTPRTYRGDN